MIVTLIGPIKWWWDENWETEAHWEYTAHRDRVNDYLVERGVLVYRPHEAFKGAWDERAQSVNDAAILASELIINLMPVGVPSVGTESELWLCEHNNRTVLWCPPGTPLSQLDQFLGANA